MAKHAHTFDLVELVKPVDGWAAGARGTVVSERATTALVEMGTERDADERGLLGVLVEAPYGALRVVEPAASSV